MKINKEIIEGKKNKYNIAIIIFKLKIIIIQKISKMIMKILFKKITQFNQMLYRKVIIV